MFGTWPAGLCLLHITVICKNLQLKADIVSAFLRKRVESTLTVLTKTEHLKPHKEMMFYRIFALIWITMCKSFPVTLGE